MPEEAIEALNGLVPGERSGSCGTAVYSGQPQFVYNTKSDLRWTSFQQFVIDFSVGACWSFPIRINDQQIVGSFALSSFEERKPSTFYRHLLETSASIAGVIFKRQQEQQLLWDMAHYDTLTGLPNRALLMLRLKHALEKAARSELKVAVLFLDLDDFKVINDTQGHDVGDEVLKLVAAQITNCLRPDDTFARLGGDEFVIVVDRVKDLVNLTLICKKIIAAVKKCNLTMDFATSTCIGVSIYPEHGGTPNLLLRNADTAMYKAKQQGVSNFYFYQHQLTQNVQNKLRLSTEMPLALLHNQFVVHYQPQFDKNGVTIVGVEALVRWYHDEKGVISPDNFIPIAEDNGFIKEIGLYVLQKACEQCLAWWGEGLAEFTLAVNVSVKQLQLGFAKRIECVLNNIGFPFARLELEVTESVIMQQKDLTELMMLNDLGVNIAMDDFGIGHSSLAQLKRLPINKLKIDRSFVQDIPYDNSDMTIARTIISMGHSMGLKIVAEGVETIEQKDFLAEEGCDFLQGFLFSKPVPAEELAELLKKHG